MQTENKLLDDMGKLATGAFGVVQGFRDEVETLVRQRLERAIAELNVVPRDEFDALKALAQRLESENESLNERLAALEKGPKSRSSAVKKNAGKADDGDSE